MEVSAAGKGGKVGGVGGKLFGSGEGIGGGGGDGEGEMEGVLHGGGCFYMFGWRKEFSP